MSISIQAKIGNKITFIDVKFRIADILKKTYGIKANEKIKNGSFIFSDEKGMFLKFCFDKKITIKLKINVPATCQVLLCKAKIIVKKLANAANAKP